MTDYKRMISYMYQYENGVKKKNVGYARVEAKNGQCKITLHMQLLGQSDSIFPTYLIHREDNRLELVYLGDSVLKAQVMDSKLTAEEGDIRGSGYGLSDMGGLLIFLNNNIFFATEWEDKPLVAQDLLDAMKPKHNNSKKTAAEVEAADTIKPMSLEEELSIPKYKLPRGWKTIEMFQKPPEVAESDVIEMPAAQVSAEVNNSETVQAEPALDQREDSLLTADYEEVTYNQQEDDGQKDDINTEIQESLVSDMDIQESPATDMDIQESLDSDTDIQESLDKMEDELEAYETNSMEQADYPDAKYIFDHCPRIYPFEDNEVQLCVKIEPKDIGLLPKESWAFSNNSFLTHGYYCYHHLIFAKLKNQDGVIYVLGVPGIYHNREQFMARMFGFNCFKSIRKRDLRQGDFGYWYIPVIF